MDTVLRIGTHMIVIFEKKEPMTWYLQSTYDQVFTLESSLSLLVSINDALMETVAHQIKIHPRQSKLG